jgi:hypothetical protein
MSTFQQIDIRLIPQVQYATPTVGQTVTVNSNGHVKLLLNPAGTLATLTVAFPASPVDGDVIQMGSTQIVTTLTMSVGTIVGALAALAVGGSGTWIYSGTASQWIKIG